VLSTGQIVGENKKMAHLKKLDIIAQEFISLQSSDTGRARKNNEESKMILQISKILTPSIRKMAKNKGLLNLLDDVQQHAYLAINTALKSWDGNMSSFSTYVHWQLRAEMKNLELHHFPERRKVSQNIDVQMLYLNRPCNDEKGSEGAELGEIMNLDPEGYLHIEDNIALKMQWRNIEFALAKIVIPQVNEYVAAGCVNRKNIVDSMRNIQIYVERTLIEESSCLVSEKHGVSRERVRQVTGLVDKSFCHHIKELMANPRPMTKDEKLAWELALSVYKEEKDHLITISGEINVRPSEQIEDECLARQDVPVNNKLAAVTTAAILSFQPAQIAAQPQKAPQEVSRAIPPAEPVVEPVEVAALKKQSSVSNKPEAIVEPKQIASSSKREFIDAQATGSKEWAIKLSEHPSQNEVKSAASNLIKIYPELRRYKPAIIRSQNGARYSIAFASLNLKEATVICASLQAQGQKCARIRIGNR